jgi:hypothetical protein
MEVNTTVNESLTQLYTKYLVADMLKQINILSLYSVTMRLCVLRVVTPCQQI